MAKHVLLLFPDQCDDKMYSEFKDYAIMTLIYSVLGHNVSYLLKKLDRYGV